MANVIYTTRDICFGYDQNPIISDLNLTFEPGMLHAIVGPNGSGKSTLLDLLGGQKTPASGSIEINTTPLAEYHPEQRALLTATVPQEFSFNFPFTVFDTVLMGRHPHIPRFARPSDDDIAHVDKAMKIMDIANLANRTLAELSGGEKQRTIVARALAQATPGLLLDEPTSSMDIRHALATLTELKRLARSEDKTIVAVLHDLNLAAAYCDHVVILKNGRVHNQGTPTETLTAQSIHEVFGVKATITNPSDTCPLTIIYAPKDNS